MWLLTYIYYWLFPKELEKKLAEEKLAKEKKEHAYMLLEYHELVKRRDRIIEILQDDASRLCRFYNLIYEVIGLEEFEGRVKGKTRKSLIKDLDLRGIDNYEQLKQRVVELEQLIFKIFTLRQKLKLYGIDYGIREKEGS